LQQLKKNALTSAKVTLPIIRHDKHPLLFLWTLPASVMTVSESSGSLTARGQYWKYVTKIIWQGFKRTDKIIKLGYQTS
jgi:hypothetical protein